MSNSMLDKLKRPDSPEDPHIFQPMKGEHKRYCVICGMTFATVLHENGDKLFIKAEKVALKRWKKAVRKAADDQAARDILDGKPIKGEFSLGYLLGFCSGGVVLTVFWIIQILVAKAL